mmetsp:Transcript_23869/g.47043  ORF Transcript_23869/g.47043 Transcript_23869/m.47043 type:complete len:126 (+) Transcript_23869:30-407(+)
MSEVLNKLVAIVAQPQPERERDRERESNSARERERVPSKMENDARAVVEADREAPIENLLEVLQGDPAWRSSIASALKGADFECPKISDFAFLQEEDLASLSVGGKVLSHGLRRKLFILLKAAKG